VLRKAELQRLLNYVSHSRHPERDRVMVLLSFRAGLRAKEIAQLTWSMITDTSGELADAISLHNKASKGRGGGRTIPLHRELADALSALKTARGERVRPDRPVIYSERAPGYSPNAVAIWFIRGIEKSGLRERPLIRAGERLSLESRKRSQKQVDRFATCRRWLDTPHFL
jgi:integrase/recombinase XerC